MESPEKLAVGMKRFAHLIPAKRWATLRLVTFLGAEACPSHTKFLFENKWSKPQGWLLSFPMCSCRFKADFLRITLILPTHFPGDSNDKNRKH